MKKILLGLGISLVLLGCQQGGQNKETLKIGGITPLTGDAASYGKLAQNVIDLSVEEINANGGINGRPLEILWEDGKCNPGDASRAAQKLTKVDKVSIITGFSCSGEVLGVAPITEKEKVIVMGALSSSPEITHAGDFVFRTFPSDSSQGKMVAEEAKKRFKNIGMLVEQSDYALGVANVFTDNFTGGIQKEEFISSESDFKTRITKLKNENIDAIFLIAQTPSKMDIILKQLSELGWTLPIWGNEVMANDPEVVARHTSLFQKVKSVVSATFMPPNNEKFRSFVERYKQKYGENPKFMDYVGPSADSINVIAHVLKKVKDPTDTEVIRDALYNLDDFEGMHGPVKFDKNGDVGLTHTLIQFDGEKFVPLE